MDQYEEIGDKWESGRVESDQSIHVAYPGDDLVSGEPCWWKVRVWDETGRPSEFTAPATFEMGLLEQSDWKGEWIAMAGAGSVDYVQGKLGQAIQLDGKRQTVRIVHDAELKPDRQIPGHRSFSNPSMVLR